VATVVNLYVDQGSYYQTHVNVSSTAGVPLDLTDFTIAAQMRKSYQSSTAYNFTSSIVNPLAGRVRIELSSESSRQIPAGRYLYDIELTSPSEEKTRVLEGLVIINPEITKI